LRERGVPSWTRTSWRAKVVAAGQLGLSQLVAFLGRKSSARTAASTENALGALVFADAEAPKALERHHSPAGASALAAALRRARSAGVTLAGYDVPLLFEVGLDAVFRPVVVVSASEATQLERVVRRDGLSEDAVRARISAQLPLDEKKRRADFVLENDGSLTDLAAQIDRLLQKLHAG